MSLPENQTAAVKSGSGDSANVSVQSIPISKELPKGQILVKINWSGLCGSDKSLLYDEWAQFGFTMKEATKGIAGHEGAGSVAAVAPDVDHLWKVGDRAGIKWIASVCRTCEFCTNGRDELQCPRQLNSGFSLPGTFQQYVVTDAYYATHLPDEVADEEAGPIMCGGVTAYVACKRSAVRPGQWLVIPGAGGGLGHLAVQYGKAMGMRVIAVDGGEDKEALCKKLGAEVFIDYTKTDDIPAKVTEVTKFGAHGVVVTTGSRAGYEAAPKMLRPGGTMVAVGLPTDPTVLAGAPPIMLALKRLNIVGSVTGTLKDVEECLDFTARGLVKVCLILTLMGM